MTGQHYDVSLQVEDPNTNLNVTENVIQTTNYNDLTHKPQINEVELEGNKSFEDLGMTEVFAKLTDIPTDVSELNNDAGYVDATGAAAAAPVQSVNGQTGDVTISVPPQENADWNENDPSNVAYIENRPFYGEPDQAETLVGEARTISGIYQLYRTTGSIQLVEGDTYKIHIPTANGEKIYTSTAFVLNGTYTLDIGSSGEKTVTYDNQVVIGDEEWVKNGDTSGDMFVSTPVNPTSSFEANDAGQFAIEWEVAWGSNITIEHILGKKIDAKYLPVAEVALTGSYDDLSDKPTIPAAQVQTDWNATSGMAAILNKPNLAAVATSGNYNDLSNKPTIPAAQVNSDWNETDTTSKAYIENKPTLSTVATSGSYNDLTNKPTIPAAQVNSDWNASSGVAQILNKPTIPSAPVNSDWNEGDPTSLAYIENRPFYGDPDNSELTTGAASLMINFYYLSNIVGSTQFVDGDTYKIHIPTADGEDVYTTTAFTMNGTYQVDTGNYGTQSITFNNDVVIGDENWVKTGATTGDMFILDPSHSVSSITFFTHSSSQFSSDWAYAAYQSGGAWGLTVTIEHVMGKQIDKKYLPLNHETWTFTLTDGTTVTKEVTLWPST